MASDDIQTIQVGRARVHLIHLGTLTVALADWLRVPREQWTPAATPFLAQPITMPALAAAIELPESVTLIDPCDPLEIANSSYAGPGYQPPPELRQQLAAVGIAPERVDHVVLTHLHFDHFSGITCERSGQLVPCFPRARHYVGRADWASVGAELADRSSLEYKTLGIVEQHGLLYALDGNADITDELSILTAPGETPGHQIVRLHSGGQTLYYIGDLFHHPVEVEHAEWQVYWADAEASRRSRERLIAAALSEHALLLAAHIATPGKLRAGPAGVEWHAV